MKKIDVCLSPDLLHLYPLENTIVVVVDILRATSCMVTAFAHDVASITAVATLEECKALQKNGYVAVAERDGIKAEGFDLGNSPFGFMDPQLKGRKIAMTTTNGTLAITMSRTASKVIIGAFLNLKSIVEFFQNEEHNVLVLCAGWKGKVNLEDTLFAGALVHHLQHTHEPACDAPQIAANLYQSSKDDLIGSLKNASHVKRLHRLNIQKDIEFCVTPDLYSVIPVLKEDVLVKL